MEESAPADLVEAVSEVHTAVVEHASEFVEGGEAPIDQWLVGETPEAFRRLKFGRVGGKEDEVDASWDHQLLRLVPSGAVKDQDDLVVLAGAHGLGELGQDDVEGLGVDLVMEPPVVLPGLGMNERGHLEGLEPMPDHRYRSNSSPCPHSAEDWLEPNSMFIHAPHGHFGIRMGVFNLVNFVVEGLRLEDFLTGPPWRSSRGEAVGGEGHTPAL